jgi:hypothetical protein
VLRVAKREARKHQYQNYCDVRFDDYRHGTIRQLVSKRCQRCSPCSRGLRANDRRSVTVL